MKILIIDEEDTYRQAVKSTLKQKYGFEIFYEATCGQTALKQLKKKEIDLVIMNSFLKCVDSCKVLHKIKSQIKDCNVVVVSNHCNKSELKQMFDAGAIGYIEKKQDYTELVRAVKRVILGKVFISGDILEQELTTAFRDANKSKLEANLSQRERDVFELMLKGFSANDIAQKLFISYHAFSTHRTSIFKKLNVKNKIELLERYGSCE